MEMIIAANTVAAISSVSARRAAVIAKRTDSEAMGIIKSQMIEVLKSKLSTGVAHFLFQKKNGEIREAWGTTSHNLMRSRINGNGIHREYVNCIAYWDVEKSEFRSLRFENLIQVF